MKRKASVNDSLCKGCRLCVTVCPVKAVIPTDRLNGNGYKVVEIDAEKCIGCGNCYKICPDYCFEVK